MARQLRVLFEGATYHVFSRSNRGEIIFPGDEERAYFIHLIGKGAERYEIDIYAFCLMGTHYHLLIQTRKANLPIFMHFILSSYATYLSHMGWGGHIFNGRYNAICIEEEEYLLTVSKYIHLNPVEARMVDDPMLYQWSSYVHYFSDPDLLDWLKREVILEYFGPGRSEAAVRYQEFVEADLGAPFPYPYEKIIGKTILGGEDFVRKALMNHEEQLRSADVSAKRELTTRKSLVEIYRVVCDRFSLRDLKKSEYGLTGSLRIARKLFIVLAREYTCATNREIANLLGNKNAAAVSVYLKRIKSALEKDTDLRRTIEKEMEAIMREVDELEV